MARKNVNGPYLLFNNVDISTNQTSVYSSVEFLDNIGMIVSWTGTTPIGVLSVEVSNDAPNPGSSTWTPTNWSALSFGSPIAVSGNTGTANIHLHQLPFFWLRLKYTVTSGTGTLTATLTSKMV